LPECAALDPPVVEWLSRAAAEPRPEMPPEMAARLAQAVLPDGGATPRPTLRLWPRASRRGLVAALFVAASAAIAIFSTYPWMAGRRHRPTPHTPRPRRP